MTAAMPSSSRVPHASIMSWLGLGLGLATMAWLGLGLRLATTAWLGLGLGLATRRCVGVERTRTEPPPTYSMTIQSLVPETYEPK